MISLTHRLIDTKSIKVDRTLNVDMPLIACSPVPSSVLGDIEYPCRHLFFIFLDARVMAHFLRMTRHGYCSERYEAENEPDIDDTDSFMGDTDSESEFGEVVLSRTVHACDNMEVEGEDMGGDDMAAGMFPAEETDEEEEVARPARRVRNVVDSDGDEDVNAEAGPVKPPGTMVVFDELAPGDAINTCEFKIEIIISLFCSQMSSVWNCHSFISIIAYSHA